MVVIGDFTNIGGVQASSLARWDGTNWSEFAGSLDVGSIGFCLASLPSGEFLVGGALSVGGSSIWQVARWDGTAWSGYGLASLGGMSSFVQTIHVEPNGDFIIGGVGNAALVGQSFRHQMLAAELDSAGAIAQVSVTNGVVATIGAF